MIMGVIADDLTGACDVASVIRAAGLRTAVVLEGSVGSEDIADVDALVAGLKIRTAPKAQAVAAAREAALAFLARGVDVLYQKYCSTFDSTPAGNIGPIADALAALAPFDPSYQHRIPSLGTPATPAIGRTQVHGHLFVGDQLLSNSPLREHPLTPMRNSDLREVLAAQTNRSVISVPAPGADLSAARKRIRHAVAAGTGHILLDALDDSDLLDHAQILHEEGLQWPRAVLGGASGLAGALAHQLAPAMDDRSAETVVEHWTGLASGRRIVVAGSTSRCTRNQTAHAASRGAAVLSVDPEAALRDADGHAAELTRAAAEVDVDRLIVIAAGDDPEQVRAGQERWGMEALATAIEEVLARAACIFRDELGVRRLVVAGGETSGAVATALGASVLLIGPDAATGVPWTFTASGPPFALLMKSGNFGESDLFTTAWEALL